LFSKNGILRSSVFARTLRSAFKREWFDEVEVEVEAKQEDNIRNTILPSVGVVVLEKRYTAQQCFCGNFAFCFLKGNGLEKLLSYS
tara:strand:+ start:493276 stop:493533 length:258 start_codon:yes stop_codon:yes gene_type:complete